MLLAISALLASLAATPAVAERPNDAVSIARSFLGAFESNVQLTEPLVTTDAVFVMGDIGGPYPHLLKALKTERGFSPSCHLTFLQQMGTVDMPLPKDLPPEVQMLSGHFTEVGGDYDCVRPDGRKTSFKVDLLLRDKLVAKFSFDFPRLADH